MNKNVYFQKRLIEQLRRKLNMPVILGMPNVNTDDQVIAAALEFDRKHAMVPFGKPMLPAEYGKALDATLKTNLGNRATN